MSNVASFKAAISPALPGKRRPAPSTNQLIHLAALLLFIVTAMTVFYGASVVRPDQKPVAVLTAAGSVLALAAIEKRFLVNIVAPTASSLRLLLCALPFLSLCTFFSAATFFEVHRREISVQADREEVWARWQRERPLFAAFQSATIVLLRAAQTEEQLAIATPIGAGDSPATVAADRRQRRSRIALLAQSEKLTKQMPTMPLTPESAKAADDSLAAAYAWAQRVKLSVPTDLMAQVIVPTPETRTPRADDVVSIMTRETSQGTPTAKFAWGAAVFVECLPFLCLFAATPGVALATRVRRGRARLASIGPAFVSPITRTDVPFRIRDGGMTGVVKLHGDLAHLCLSDFLASVESLVPDFAQKFGQEIRGVAIVDDEGEPVDLSTRLAQALAEGPLLLELQWDAL